jgi:hypothetical protein
MTISLVDGKHVPPLGPAMSRVLEDMAENRTDEIAGKACGQQMPMMVEPGREAPLARQPYREKIGKTALWSQSWT